jgi:ribonucleoside-diphosphate reductase alpha chain
MRMQSAFQRHCDASISKTINFPREATPEDVRTIYELAIDEGVKGVTVYRDGCRDLQPMSLKHSDKEESPTAGRPSEAQVRLDETAMLMRVASDGQMALAPIRLPEIMSCLRIRQMTPFGNMHVKVSVDPGSGREREVFAQLGKGGDVANSDLEAICRILSLWLRSNGSLDLAVKQLDGIGSSMTVPTKDGRIMSLADGLARALRRYLDAKRKSGLRALLLGDLEHEVELPQTGARPAPTPTKSSARPRNVSQYKLKCPSCTSVLAFEEGCVKCYSCGFSQC